MFSQFISQRFSTYLGVVEEHAAQFVAGVRLHVRVAQQAHLIAQGHLEILQTQRAKFQNELCIWIVL